MFFKVQFFQGPGFSSSWFFQVQFFLDPGFSGSRFFRVWFQCPGPGFRMGPDFPGSGVRVQVLKASPNQLSLHIKAAVRRCSSKQLFLKISQYSQEYICVGVSFLLSTLNFFNLYFMVTREFLSSFDKLSQVSEPVKHCQCFTCADFNNFNIFIIGIIIIIFIFVIIII